MHRARTYPRPATNHDAVNWDTFEKAPGCKWDWDTPHLTSKKTLGYRKPTKKWMVWKDAHFVFFHLWLPSFRTGWQICCSPKPPKQHHSMVFSHSISPILKVIWWQGHCTPEQWSQDNGHYNILLPSEKSFFGMEKNKSCQKILENGTHKKKNWEEKETRTVWAQNFQG